MAVGQVWLESGQGALSLRIFNSQVSVYLSSVLSLFVFCLLVCLSTCLLSVVCLSRFILRNQSIPDKWLCAFIDVHTHRIHWCSYTSPHTQTHTFIDSHTTSYTDWYIHRLTDSHYFIHRQIFEEFPWEFSDRDKIRDWISRNAKEYMPPSFTKG